MSSEQAKKLVVNGHTLNVQVQGPDTGAVVLLLHHGLGSIRAWKAQSTALVQHGYRTIAYDRWGYGASQVRSCLDVPDFDQDIADLATLLDLLEVEQAALVGHSDGGTIALLFAALYPRRVCCVAAIAAHVYVETKMESGIQAVRQSFENDPRFQDGMHRVHGDQYKAVFDNWFSGWLRPDNLEWDMRPQLAGIRCPVWVVQGEQDEHATPQHARDIAAAIQNAALWLAPGTGHMLPQELPEDFNQRLLTFLAGCACQ